MKIKLLALSLITYCCTNAQITLTQSDVPSVGTIAVEINDTVVTTSPGSPGANQSWDLTTMKNQGVDTIKYLTPSGTPYFSMYPSANVVIQQIGYNGSNIYTHYYTDANGANILGYAFAFFAGPFVAKYSPPYHFMNFPGTYGMSIIDSTIATAMFAYPVPPTDSMKVKSTYHYTENMDGWGTVTTPAGSFSCLRDIALRHHIDSTFTHNSSTGVWSLYKAPETKQDTFYFWYSNNQKFIVAEIQVQQNLPKQGFYLQVSPATGVSEIGATAGMNVFPNPFCTEASVLLGSALKNGELLVDNCYGQTVRQIKNISGQTLTLSRGDLTSGLYLLRLVSDGQIVATEKLVVADY